MDQANIVIIGGGVVGCAFARQLSAHFDDVFLLEAMPKLGMGASTRNSGVIHSGIYYPPGSLKAKLCVRGNYLTREFCAAHNVPHRNTGKIVIAASVSETQQIEELMDRGRTNGVEGLRIVDSAAIRAREPHVEGAAALEVPSTGILSSEELVKAYGRLAQDQGAHLVTHAQVTRLEPCGSFICITSDAGEVEARCVINSAGLFADEIATMLGSPLASHRIYPVRGEYCELVRSKSDWVRGLVYPLPHSDGLSLGTHLTKTIAGTVLIGPTAHYIASKTDYEQNREPAAEFARRASVMLPGITADDLVPAYTGIRAKLVPPNGHGIADFVIERDPQYRNVIQLIGIESPGLTSAPAIAEHVEPMVKEILS
jgi:glycerol-3-phosphate dehydrogenase